MALDINASLATFKMFTDFAQQRVDEGKGKSIARANNAEAGGLAGRTITAVGGALLATAVVGLLPPEKTEAFLDLLLEANTETFGPQDRALGMLRDTGEVVLQWRIPTRDVELDGFCAELEAFVNQVEQWRLALENFRPAAEEAAARDEEAPAMGLPSSGFISV